MKEKKFFAATMTLTCTLLVLMGGVSYWLDYYGVFRGSREAVCQSLIETNDRVVKMEYLLADSTPRAYEAFLWGSSRIEKMDPSVTGLRAYGMGASEGMPQDCLQDLQRLLRAGYHPQAVYLGIDDFTYTHNWRRKVRDLRLRPYTEDLKERGIYYWELMMNSHLTHVALKRKLKHWEGGKTFLQQNGMYQVPEQVEQRIEKDPQGWVRRKDFQKATQFAKHRSGFQECINTLREIKALCDQQGIRFVPFFNAQHMATYLADDIKLMNRFKKELVKISPFWDFSGVNYVTTNNYFWYETSHPRAFICDKILDTVSGQHQISWVPDFGVYVTADNVDAFCEKAVRDRESYDPRHEQWIPTAEERRVMTKRLHYPW